MLKKLIFFKPTSQYGVLDSFTEGLSAALNQQGVETLLLSFEEDKISGIIEKVEKEKPDCTVTFNPIRPLKDGSQFCDHLKVPHLTCLVDASIEYLFLFNSPYSIVSCVDRFFCDYVEASGFKNIFFLPHAISSDFPIGEESERVYEVSMLGTCIDYEERKASWEENFPPNVCTMMERAVQKTLSDASTPYFLALLSELEREKVSPQEVSIVNLFGEVELFVKGVDRVNMIKSIKNSEVHVFGDCLGTRGWEHYLKEQNNVVVHSFLDFSESVEIMRKSKVVLNSFPFFKRGSHERIFYGLASGAFVVCNDTLYMRENFKEEDGVILYQPWAAEFLDEKVSKSLADEAGRQKLVSSGREKVMTSHTWEVRAKELCENLSHFL